MNANYVAIVSNNNSSIPNSLPMVYIPFKDWAHYYHVILLCKFLKELSRFSINWFSKFTPSFLACAEGKRHCPGFLNLVRIIRNDIPFGDIAQCPELLTIIPNVPKKKYKLLTCRHKILTPEAPAASITGFILSMIAFFWSAK
jgi:hypothetical protein